MPQTKSPASSGTVAAPVKKAARKTTSVNAGSAKSARQNPLSAKTAPQNEYAREFTAEQHYRMIAEAAYYIAEKRGFAPGDPASDWAEAEAQIRALAG